MPDIRDDLNRLRVLARGCWLGGSAERESHYRRLIAWIETADEAMRAVVEDHDSCATGASAYREMMRPRIAQIRAALLPEVER